MRRTSSPRPRARQGGLRPRPSLRRRRDRWLHAAVGRALPALAHGRAAGGGRRRLHRPLRGLPPKRSASSCPMRGSSAITSTSSAAPTPRWTPSAANANASRRADAPRAPVEAAAWTRGTRALPRPAPAAEGRRAPHRTRPPPPLRTVRARPHPRRGVGLKEAFRAIYRATDRGQAEQRLEEFLAAVDHAGLPAFDAFAKGIRSWRSELLA